jgi:FkbM family methyltransferase
MTTAKVALVRLLSRLPVLRSPVARRRLLDARRAQLRRRRRRLEARGDARLSRPALHDMDRKLERHLDFDGGFFVEAGANDGYEQSNTYYLERFRGWRGILVEPIPELYEQARIERPAARVVNCALVAPDDAGSDVRMRYGGLMSLVAGARGSEQADREWVAHVAQLGLEDPYDVDVTSRTLSSVIDEAGAPAVDLLSLDVEGYEPQVLAGLDLERHAPRYVLVEIRDMASGREPIEAALGARYELVEELSPFDALYVRRDAGAAG